MKQKPELLIPAGNLEKLRTAVLYGADAVYIGAAGLSLRARQAEFSDEELALGIIEAHNAGVKVYAALNLFAKNEDLPLAEITMKKLDEMGIDAFIISDPGMIRLAHRVAGRVPIHLSTQANTTNKEAVHFWQDQGVQRVVLARELSLAEITEVSASVPSMEYEIFAHGAMCMAYSGRCFLSSYWTERSSNRGDCTHPCRWEYKLTERTRPTEALDIEEDDRYTYFLNSKDLCMIEHLPEIFAAGVTSLKVEGRMKTNYYVAGVTAIYRQAIDAYMQNPQAYQTESRWLEELGKISHREYTTGFYFATDKILEVNQSAGYIQTHDFVGTAVNYDKDSAQLTIAVRNGIYATDEMELFLPSKNLSLDIAQMRNPQTGELLKAAHNGSMVVVPLQTDADIPSGAIIRRHKKSEKA